MAFAPFTVQWMPDRLSRLPITTLQPLRFRKRNGCNAECIVTRSLSPACSPVNHFEGFLVGIRAAARSDAISLSVALKRPERSFGGSTDSRASTSPKDPLA